MTIHSAPPFNRVRYDYRDRHPALDITRGLAVLGMILVVSPGSWHYRFDFLSHALWHGYTAADIVFPLFLFCVGASLSFAYMQNGIKIFRWLKICKRVLMLIVLGLFLNLLPTFDLQALRIPGILQRIALCYLITMLVFYIACKIRTNSGVSHHVTLIYSIIGFSVLWFLILQFTSAPGFETGDMSQAGTLASHIDRSIFTEDHLWPYGLDEQGKVVYDPEGLLATFPATINVLFGIIVAYYLGRNASNASLIKTFILGFILVASVHLLDHFVLINKPLWTPSFAIVSSAWCIIVFSSVGILCRVRGLIKLFRPCLILGGNALLAFALSQVFLAYSGYNIYEDKSLQAFFYDWFLGLFGNEHAASFVCAVLVAFAITVILYPFHNRNWHLKL